MHKKYFSIVMKYFYFTTLPPFSSFLLCSLMHTHTSKHIKKAATHSSAVCCYLPTSLHLLPVLAISQPSCCAADVTEEPSEHLSQTL